MFRFLKKTKKKETERNLLDLPILDPKQMTLDGILKHLRSGTAIWTWYTLPEQACSGSIRNKELLYGLEQGYLDALAVYRIEGDYLCRYRADFIADTQDPMLRLDTIWPASNSAVFDVLESCFRPAYRVYYDPENRTNDLLYYVHDLTAEDIADYLQTHPCMQVSEEHFLKKNE